MATRIFKAALFIWIILWVIFTARDVFLKNNIRGYMALLERSAEGKRSLVTGDRLYEYLQFCNNGLPGQATYKLIGLEEDSIDTRRAAYYLYPKIESRSPDYLLVYEKKGYSEAGYERVKGLDMGRYILKRRRRA